MPRLLCSLLLPHSLATSLDTDSTNALESNYGSTMSAVYADIIWLSLHASDRLAFKTGGSINRAKESASNDLLTTAQNELVRLMNTQQARLAKKIAHPDENGKFLSCATFLATLSLSNHSRIESKLKFVFPLPLHLCPSVSKFKSLATSTSESLFASITCSLQLTHTLSAQPFVQIKRNRLSPL